ncbi:Peptidyl-prolyl cis-trans isomerase Mip precursor [Rubripirellula tenax]|uniref:Peptidyl-prolyl cis-trans isomerase n=1 Tax=Rubripirellula tenax TaxID=2528015 RepID=A0A5C6FA82_9BACT|nr:FKBP-type peptidyl-prolyl cis-trans isomerase [Rubripirellula tenax]TWU58673.1 Peptidyl-prolyl cis-trans isomerase Mip precursor [Rubripirellula tenax]
MKLTWVFSVVISVSIGAGCSAFGQGAALQGIANTVDKLAQDVQNQQDPIKAGPDDKLEKVAPGKIDADAEREFKETPSGLRYRILRKSDKKKPTPANSVVAHYKGWLDNGKIFDSSYRKGSPIPFPLRGVIAGWTEGVPLIGEGGMIELDIPYQLGYGSRGMPAAGIGHRERLHFIVELVEIK